MRSGLTCFKRDIYGLKKSLLIRTSTRNNKNQILYDVFDMSGRYVDNVYFNTSEIILTVYEDSIFVLEKDENELLSIVKYNVLDKNPTS